MSTCRPTDHHIPFGNRHRIVVIIEDQGQRYVPEYLTNTGTWLSLIPEGESRQMLKDARNDCALHAGLEVIQ